MVDSVEALDVGQRAGAVAREVQIAERADVGAGPVDRVAGEQPGVRGGRREQGVRGEQ